ncbi:hypothetical protein [Paenibacillus nasutitermitis]|uniref:Uncharacterized protein n=1 Tax=Paenibacillus nasutitermitis TaxID=1652958 RepID=A0A916YXB2_9BACL|nr:hypothetical protein [Paenibacillus nasutitermitis]GGD66011.1 hypothetical protein GCM10010911_24690 [Paenibacillus nasutitermitis]
MKQLYLAALFTLMAAVGLWVVESIEGSKITTSEYMDLTFYMVFFGAVLAFPFYFIVFCPIGIAVDKWLNRNLPIKLISYMLVGGVSGYYIFEMLYEVRFVEEFGLHSSTSIILFAAIGALLSIAETMARTSWERAAALQAKEYDS